MTYKYVRKHSPLRLHYQRYDLVSHTIFPLLRLVKNPFHAERRFLAKPWLVDIALTLMSLKLVLFMPAIHTEVNMARTEAVSVEIVFP
jgi:hypothetical protein